MHDVVAMLLDESPLHSEIDTDEDNNHLELPLVPPSLPINENKDNNSDTLLKETLLRSDPGSYSR